MIYNYEIKNDILYVYLDVDDEFAKLNWKDKKQKLEDNIKNFIEENKINFKGTKVAIVVGGVVLGTLLLGSPSNINETDKIINNNVLISTNILDSKTDSDIEAKEEVIENVEAEVVVENQTTNKTTENNINQATINQLEGNKEQVITNQTVNINQSQSINESTKIEVNNNQDMVEQPNNNIVEEIQENISNETQVEEQKTYVTIYRSNGQVITLELEEYLIGVVGAEMPASFSDQALMSQAVIARTYTLKAIQRGVILTDTSSTQNYKNNDELRTTWGSSYDYYYNKVKSAVESTEGLYLTYNGSIIEAVYHSTSNGVTEDASYVWGNSFPYLVSVDSSYDSTNPSFIKEQFISYVDLTIKLGTEINIDTNFNILSRTSGNRILNVEINGNSYTGVEIRTKLGLRSADFEIQKNDTGIVFITKGYGHGVGLSQYGANGMAKAGYNYEQILKHYYPGVQISQM